MADAVRILGTKTAVARAAKCTARHIDHLLTSGKPMTKKYMTKGIEEATTAAGNPILAVWLADYEPYSGPLNGPPPPRKRRRGPLPVPPNLRVVEGNGRAAARQPAQATALHGKPRKARAGHSTRRSSPLVVTRLVGSEQAMG